ncbi:ABC transporter substrate-binding protein [Arcobacter suis]|uniref:histidine kinase n=5 Tax=Arcobacter suis TaxID=1278212 RepID=A0AAD0T1T5_9BACT|nr:transporter substrate-binding domain-containing protein [Arcobacter suis]AXX90542.1 BvgS-like domain-containing signal transduction sensor histidine kinase (NMT1 domain) [Arcobacter suis CECT 7833]
MRRIIKGSILIFLIINNFLFANQTDELKKVTLRLEWKHQFEFAGFYAAIEKGYYKDVGLELEIREFQEGVNITQEVLSGNATFGISSSALILEKLNKKPVVLIASYFKQNALALVTKPNIKTPADLKNKKIMAVDWEMGHTSLGVILKDAGITSNDYTLVNHDFKVDKFVNGEVDAMSVFITSQPYELDKLGVKYNILNPANFGIYSYDVELFTSEDVINSDMQKVKNFVEATNKGWEYAFKNKEEIVELIYNKYSKRKTKESLLFEANQTEKIFKTNVFKIGAIAPELIKLNADMYTNLDLVDKDYDITTILNNYYFDINNKIQTILTNEEKNYIKNSIIKVHNELNWPPFNYNINGKATGYSIDYMNLLALKVGLNVEYISGPNWNDFLELMKDNKLDVMLNIAKTEDREKYLNFTTPYLKAVDSVFVRKEVNNLKSLDDFKGKTIAVIEGFYEEELFKKYYPEIRLLLVKDSLEGLKKLAFKEVDGFVDSFAVANYFIENNFIINLKPAFEIKDQRFNLSMGLATNKENKLLQEILDKAKKEITVEEEFELKRKWINTNNIGAKSTIPFSVEEEDYLSTKKVITMCVDPDWEPFEILDKDGKHVGIAADIIKLITSKLGIEIKIIPTKTWEESIEFSKAKKCDILSFLNQTPQRESWLTFTKPIFQDPNVIISRVESDAIEDLSKVKASIAIPKGTAMYERFEKDFPNLIIIPVNSENEAFKFVEEKKADLTVRSMIISAYTIKDKGLFNLKIINQPKNYENYLRMGVIKEEDILRDILNKAIITLTKDDIQNIVNKWVSIKYEKVEDYTYLWLSVSLIIILLVFFLYRQYLLKHNNNFLQNEILKRTHQLEKSNQILKEKKDELDKLNSSLEEKIKDEVEKNKLFQEKLFKADKLASMGEMMSNIAHQWRQPLSMISTVATGTKIQKEFGTLIDEELIQNMDLINKNAQYLSETINDFRNFIKGDRKIKTYDLSATINNFLHIIESSIKKDSINIILNLEKNIKINGYPNELIQCLINIFNNSKDALEEIKQENPLIFISTVLQNNTIFISIKDNAGGIPQNIITKIYDPYFTTKHKSQGTGLGLHMTYKLIDEGMHGKIEAQNVEFEYENKIYRGAEFIISLNI